MTVEPGRPRKDVLWFIVCGDTDDGARMLIECLRREASEHENDRVDALTSAATLSEAPSVDPDFALPLQVRAGGARDVVRDAVPAFFSTGARDFVAVRITDVAGLRDLVAIGSIAGVAVILVDARDGVLTQTRRDAFLASLLGIRNAVLIVNELGLVGDAKHVFDGIEQACRTFAARIGLGVTCIPASPSNGDNVTMPGTNTPWFRGPTLLEYLGAVQIDDKAERGPFRMPIQSIDRPDLDFRGLSGRIVGGSVGPGDRLRVLPSGKESVVTRIVARDRVLACGTTGQSVTLAFANGVDAMPGDMLVAADAPAAIADQFEATLIWLSEDEMFPGRSYLLKCGTKTVGATIATPKYKVNVDTLEHLAAKTLHRGDVGVCNLNLDERIAFDPYAENRATGGFVLIDRQTNETIGAGLLHFALRRSQNIHWQAIEVNKRAHAALNAQRPCIVWFTGLSGAGKSTIANFVEKRLHALGRHTYLLDGDNVRHGLNKDLGFTEADRVENIRRVAEVARLMVDAGLIVLVSFISPFAAERRMARALVAQDEFHEVFVDAPLEVAEQRDKKGLYRKARRGEIKNFTGIDSPYERPAHPEIRIDTTAVAAEDAAEAIVAHLRAHGILDVH